VIPPLSLHDALPISCRAPEQLFISLDERLAGVDAQRAVAANEALLRTFTQLLAALIGERLTQRLLESASAATDTAPGQQKNAQRSEEHTSELQSREK